MAEPTSARHRFQGSRRALLLPWLPIAIAVDLVALIIAGVLANTFTESAAVNAIWWVWLLLVAASMAFLVWRLRGPLSLDLGPDGIEYRHKSLHAAYRWSDVQSFTVTPRKGRPTLCLRLIGGLGPEVLFAQRLSRGGTPPFHEPRTGWIVLCHLSHFKRPTAEIEATITRLAGPAKRVGP